MGNTKEKLMDAALELFSQKGYHATSVDEIAESIGIKGPNIYKYFKGKEGLFEELHTRWDISYRSKMGLEGGPVINNGKDLKKVSIEQISFTMNDDNVKKLRKMYTIEQFRTEHLSRQATIHQYTNITRMFKGVFDHLIEKGVMDPCDSELLALEYVAPMTLLLQLTDREPDRKDEAMDLINRHIDSFISKYLKA